MATIALGPIEFRGTISGNAPQMLAMPEAASQTFRTGAILTKNLSGYVEADVADSTRVLGVAAEPGHNGASAGDYRTLFYVANGDNIFVANYGGSSVTAITDPGFGYGVVLTSGNWHVDKTDLTNRTVIVIALDPRDAVGDTRGRVHFIFHPRVRVLDYTS